MNAIRRRYLYYFGAVLALLLAGLGWGFWFLVLVGIGLVVWTLLGLVLLPFQGARTEWSVDDLEAGLRSGSPLLVFLSSHY